MKPLKPEQIKAGSKQIMTHAERQKFLANSELGRWIGFPQDDKED
jgi:hypothetical protein